MNILASLILVVVVMIIGTRFNQDNKDVQKETQEVQGVEVEATKVPNVTSGPVSTISPTSPEPTIIPSTPKPQAINTDEYIYPGSVIVNSNGGTMKLTSGDDPDTITQWYKEIIKNAGMNVNSFVMTKTNGNVLNKLSGADGTTKIEIEIKKQATNSDVEISVTKLAN